MLNRSSFESILWIAVSCPPHYHHCRLLVGGKKNDVKTHIENKTETCEQVRGGISFVHSQQPFARMSQAALPSRPLRYAETKRAIPARLVVPVPPPGSSNEVHGRWVVHQQNIWYVVDHNHDEYNSGMEPPPDLNG